MSELDFDPEELALLRRLFRGEAHDGLEAMTARVLAAAAAPLPPAALAETITELMHVTHTLKGAAGTVGLHAMVDLAHRLEDALAGLARAPARWSAAAAERIVEVADALRGYLDEGDPGSETTAARIREAIAGIGGGGEAAAADDRGAAPEPVADTPTEVIAADPGAAAEPRTWLRVEPERIDALMSSAGELLFDRTRIERRVQLLRTLARDLARTRQTLHDALGGPGCADAPRPALLAAIDAELASEATLLSQTTAHLLDEIEALRRTIGVLQRGLVRIRMESARRLMSHAARTLRALRRTTGVRAELRTLGEDTELDKVVVEQLVDPLTQLLRNAVAHGIEPPSERQARGKPATGTITVRARQDGPLLVLEVGDDGRGVDTAAVRARLVATGAWTAARAAAATEADVLAALLGTGVSVRGGADELAGRGVGLGLVRETVARLGGDVTVSTRPGGGTTFALRLPLATALAQAMLFKVAGQVYAIPSAHVVATTFVDAGATAVRAGAGGAIARPELARELPVLRLEELLGGGGGSERRPGVVVSFGGRAFVCSVDRIVGSREVIVKPLGPLLEPLALYAGATISGAGKVQLILDPAQLVQRAYPEAPHAAAPGAAAVTDDDAELPAAPLAFAGRALVVDDSRAIREAITSMLGREGWIVDVAEDGARALERTRQTAYDLLVTDLEMPELGGFELIARLRADPRGAALRVVVITSRASPEHRRRARELDVDAFIGKPITRRKLLEALAHRDPGRDG